jgi:hypothetical protein
MAKKQSRRSVSLNRSTYERLKAYCETNDISMSQFVESRIGDFLGRTTSVVVPKSAPVRGARPVETTEREREREREAAPAPATPKKVDETAAKRAAERIFTF